VAAVRLPTAGERPAAGSNAVVSGWGGLSEGGAGPDQLHSVTVQIIAHNTCNNNYNGDIDDNSMICAGASGKDSCQVYPSSAMTFFVATQVPRPSSGQSSFTTKFRN
jgi:hypothetical protein